MPRVRPLMALRSVSLNVPAPAGDSFEVSHVMRKRPVSLGTSPTVAVPRPCQDPTARVTATIGCGPDGCGVQLLATKITKLTKDTKAAFSKCIVKVSLRECRRLRVLRGEFLLLTARCGRGRGDGSAPLRRILTEQVSDKKVEAFALAVIGVLPAASGVVI